MKNTIVLLIGLLMLTTSCASTASEPQETIVQKVVFHYSYQNFAWGHQQNGWYIDNQGNVWKMDRVDQWEAESRQLFEGGDKVFTYDAEQLEQSYQDGRGEVLTTIEPETLAHYYQLIETASKGTYSEPEQRGADQGASLYGCMLYDEENNTYRKIVLSISGDWNIANLSDEAKTLDAWLRQIQAEE